MITFILGILLLGIFVGLVSGMFGLGGGGIIVPALLLLLPLINVPESQIMFMAMGTAFATMIISTATTSYHHYQHQNIDLKSLRLFLPPLLITVLLTSYIVTSINQNFLKLFFSLFLIYFGFKMLRSRKNRSIPSEIPANLKTKNIFAAMMIGIISTLGGVSGAGLIVPFFNKTGLSIKKSIGTAAFCGLFLTIFASVGFILNGLQQTEDLPPYSFGFIHLPTVLLISIISVPMTKIGVKIMSRLPDKHLKQYFALFLITLSIYMMIISLKSLMMLKF